MYLGKRLKNRCTVAPKLADSTAGLAFNAKLLAYFMLFKLHLDATGLFAPVGF